MALAETARLIASLEMQDKFSPTVNKAQSGLTALQRSTAGAGGGFTRLSGLATGAGAAMSTFRGRISEVGRGLAAVTGVGGVLGLAGALTHSVTAAKDFAEQMELIHTQAGATQEEVHNLTGAVAALAPAVGTAPELLAAGLFHIESAGLRGAKAMEALKIAAEGAKVGNADLESVTNALVGALNSGIKGTSSMSETMGVLNAIVGAGNLRMEDLASALSSGIFPAARTFGVSIQSVGAAIATLASQAVPADEAATRLRLTLSLLGAPTAAATKQLKSIGLSATDLAVAMRGPQGILGAISLLKERLDASGLSAVQQAQLLSRAFGGGRTAGTVEALLLSVQKLGVAQNQITKGAGEFGDAWAKTQEQAAFKFAKFGATVEAVAIRLGNAVLPTVTDALAGIGDFLVKNQDKLIAFVQGAIDLGKTAVGVIGNVIGGLGTLWSAVPGPLQDLLIKGFAADRTIKFLFGFSPAKLVVEPIANVIGNFIGKLIGGRALPQNIFATQPIPVFVVNQIGGIPGAVGGAATAAEGAAGAGLASRLLLGFGKWFVGPLSAVLIGAEVAGAINKNVIGPAQDFEHTQFDRLAKSTDPKQLQAGLDAITKAQADLGSGLSLDFGHDLQALGYDLSSLPIIGDALGNLAPDLEKQRQLLQAQLDAIKAQGGIIAPPGQANLAHGQLVPRTPPTPPKPPLTAAEFERILRTTPFIGTAQYKSIFEQFTSFKGGGRGQDPFGAGFLKLVQRLDNPKAPAVMGEISGHLRELNSLEKYYLAHGDIQAAKKVEGVIDAVDRLIGVTNRNHPAALAAQKATQDAIRQGQAQTGRGLQQGVDATNRAGQATHAAISGLASGVDRTAANTGVLTRKRTSFVSNVTVNVQNNISALQQWTALNTIRKAYSVGDSTGGSI